MQAPQDLRWVALGGSFTNPPNETSEIVFQGSEYDPPEEPRASSEDGGEVPVHRSPSLQKFVDFGTLLFNRPFTEGTVRCTIEFELADYRSQAAIAIQYDPSTDDMFVFGLQGGGIPLGASGGSGFLYRLSVFATAPSLPGTAPDRPKRNWQHFVRGGQGWSLRAGHPYQVEVTVEGSRVTASIDSVQVVDYQISAQALPGHQVGLFCGSHGKIYFRNFEVRPVRPKAFVVMQFNTPEYEALYRDVIEPICAEEGLQSYRGDSTYLPGLIVDDIKKQIAESRIVIAEITPANPNVYYEVGYADALNKPLILIADRKEGLKPFDVRSYRTIFYENSIGGKKQVEDDLRRYLRSIMATRGLRQI